MAQIKVKIQRTTTTWNAARRYRVGNTVKYLGEDWANLSGHNSEPVEGSADWLKVGIKPTGTRYWQIGNYMFEWKKLNSNQTNIPIQGEVCANGYWTDTRFVVQAVLEGTDPYNKEDWTPIIG